MSKQHLMPIEVSDVDMVFGGAGRTFEKLMPDWHDIPEEIRDHWHWNQGWTGLAHTWFSSGIDVSGLKPKEGIDKDMALRHIGTIMRSFRPKHEHKIAAAAYLFSLWFEETGECQVTARQAFGRPMPRYKPCAGNYAASHASP